MATQVTINTKNIPVSVLKKYAETLHFGEFVREVREHYDPLYKMPLVKDGNALYVVDCGEKWGLIYAEGRFEAENTVAGYQYVDKELISITPPAQRSH